MRVLTVVGTRPEMIKLAPVVHALERRTDFVHRLCLSGQHRTLVHPLLDHFGLKADFDLDLMIRGQTLSPLTASILAGIADILDFERPDWLIVQGDTSTAFAAALAGYYANIKILHVEAGLRSYQGTNPWPEEAHRRMVAPLATLHAAPTRAAAGNLEQEGIDKDSIFVCGNSGIDALCWMRERLKSDCALAERMRLDLPIQKSGRRLIFVTCHRREYRDIRLKALSKALVRLAMRADVDIVLSLHPNPDIIRPMRDAFKGIAHIHLIDSLDYPAAIMMMEQAHFLISDSGGLQEEATALGKPILVLRTVTERQEAVEAGAAILVGLDERRIYAEACRLLDHEAHYAGMARPRQIYGDGRAAERIVTRLLADSEQVCPYHKRLTCHRV